MFGDFSSPWHKLPCGSFLCRRKKRSRYLCLSFGRCHTSCVLKTLSLQKRKAFPFCAKLLSLSLSLSLYLSICFSAMKFSVPSFLRKRSQFSSASPSPRSCKDTGLSQPAATSDLSTVASFSASASTPSPRESSSSEGGWSGGLIQAQKMSCAKDIVVSERPSESSEKVDSRFSQDLPALGLRQELEDAFMRFDANHDGKISAMELGSVLRSLGDDPSEEELLSMVKEADRDGDGFIDLKEFIMLNSADLTAEVDVLREAFSVFDADEDGKISVKELHCVLSRLGETCSMEECRRMIEGVDRDGDGFVDFEEFCSMMSTH